MCLTQLYLHNLQFTNICHVMSRNTLQLDKFTEHEFQVLALTFLGDGSKSSIKIRRGPKKIVKVKLSLNRSIVFPY